MIDLRLGIKYNGDLIGALKKEERKSGREAICRDNC